MKKLEKVTREVAETYGHRKQIEKSSRRTHRTPTPQTYTYLYHVHIHTYKCFILFCVGVSACPSGCPLSVRLMACLPVCPPACWSLCLPVRHCPLLACLPALPVCLSWLKPASTCCIPQPQRPLHPAAPATAAAQQQQQQQQQLHARAIAKLFCLV